MPVDISTEQCGSTACLMMRGKANTSTCVDLTKELSRILEQGLRDIVIDVTEASHPEPAMAAVLARFSDFITGVR